MGGGLTHNSFLFLCYVVLSWRRVKNRRPRSHLYLHIHILIFWDDETTMKKSIVQWNGTWGYESMNRIMRTLYHNFQHYLEFRNCIRMRLMHLQFNTFTVNIFLRSLRMMENIHIPLHYALLCVWKDEKWFVVRGEELKKL